MSPKVFCDLEIDTCLTANFRDQKLLQIPSENIPVAMIHSDNFFLLQL